MKDPQILYERTTWLFEKYWEGIDTLRSNAGKGILASAALGGVLGFFVTDFLNSSSATGGRFAIQLVVAGACGVSVLLSFIFFSLSAMPGDAYIPGHKSITDALNAGQDRDDWALQFAKSNLNALIDFPAEYERTSRVLGWAKIFFITSGVLLFILGSLRAGEVSLQNILDPDVQQQGVLEMTEKEDPKQPQGDPPVRIEKGDETPSDKKIETSDDN